MRRKKINETDIIDNIIFDQENLKMSIKKKEIHIIVNKFLNNLRASIENLKYGERIELRRFGTFGIKRLKPKYLRAVCNFPYFKAGFGMKINVCSGKN